MANHTTGNESAAIVTERPYQAEICNICGSTRYSVVHHFDEWNLGRDPVRNVDIIRCRGCGVRRRKPGIIDEYEETYHTPYIEQGQAIHPHQLSHFADLMTARLRQFNQIGVRFLDVGCSTGRALRLARAIGFSVVGLDYSKWAVDFCTGLGFETRQGSLIGQWQEAEVFDVIHCCHTIEHVPDPMAYLVEFYPLLKSGGQAMVAMPNYASIERLILRDNWGPFCLDSHLWQFAAAQMCRLLRQTGFSIAFCRTLHGHAPDGRLKRRLLDAASAIGFADGCNIIAVKA
ncbi:MAG: class I SAM-dependent methyltransferase [Chthoniobacterales bacterium]